MVIEDNIYFWGPIRNLNGSSEEGAGQIPNM